MEQSDALEVVAELAEGQWGMFTTAQAEARGVPRTDVARLVLRELARRLRHGVHMMPGVPSGAFEDVRAEWLATEPAQTAGQRRDDPEPVIVSDESAALIHGMGDLPPGGVHLTSVRRLQSRQQWVTIHRRQITDREYQWVDGLPVTTPRRTLEDLADSGRWDQSQLRAVANDAITHGLIPASDLVKSATLARVLPELAAPASSQSQLVPGALSSPDPTRPIGCESGPMDTLRNNRRAWESASEKHVREYDDLLHQAMDQSSLLDRELDLLHPLLAQAPAVVHLMSGHGLDDVALVAAGARSVVGVDFSVVAATAAQRRADELGLACRYLVAELPGAPLCDACTDLVYTGKGALIWAPDLDAWARDAARLLRPRGHLFIYEAHPTVPLWTWDEDAPRIRPDRSYFARSHVNDTFPARGAVEWQRTLGEILNAVISAGLEIRHMAEYPEPFWQPHNVEAAAWAGRLPNSFALLARKK